MALHRCYSDPTEPEPHYARIGRLCKEFNCLPSAILREEQEIENDMLDLIVEARAYAYCYAHLEVEPSKRPKSALMDLCDQIEMELAAEAVKDMKRGC